jgi:hypothetical protein
VRSYNVVLSHTGHASNFSYSLPRYRIQSLEHACIFSTSKPKGQTTLLASYVDAGNSFPLGSMSFTINNNSSKAVSEILLLAFHCNISNVLPNFLCAPLCNLGNGFCDLLTYVQISLTPSPFPRSFPLPLATPHREHHLVLSSVPFLHNPLPLVHLQRHHLETSQE